MSVKTSSSSMGSGGSGFGVAVRPRGYIVVVAILSEGKCQDQFFTDLISMRGLGVRGWPSGKTEMLHSVVVLPE